jgi:phosphoribosylanthranilate isomerase
MPLFVKICGLTDRQSIEAAVAAGADAIGFVFAESPRRVTASRAAQLADGIPGNVIRVAVMHHPDPLEWQEVAEIFRPDWLQTDFQDFAGLDPDPAVRRLPVFRDTPLLDDENLAAQELVLFEAASSGQGNLADWGRARRLAATTSLILAGGLSPDNVAEAIKQVKPFGVDVSSGVERIRGVKDPARIAAFVKAARQLEHVHAG